MEPIVGIDLGTTNSLVAYCQAGEVSILADSKGRRLLPSIVTWQDDVSLIGHEAREQFASYPESTLYSVKRLFGKNFSELLASGHNRFAFKLSGDEKEVRIQAGSKEVYPFEVSAKVLQCLREIAEDALGQSVTRAVITVPAWFDDSQRQETRHAASLAGLEVVRMINEPTAAALAYGIDTKGKGKVVVYDLGGGTFDVSVLNLEDGVFQVLATHGDTFLGGDDMDHAIADWLLKQLPESSGATDAVQIALKFAAEQLKIQLSEASEATINLDLPSGFRLQATLTRAEFEKLIEPLVQKTLKSARIALRDSGLEISDITDVVLVGGATRVPCIREAVRQFFARSPFTGINPDEVVAMGAATQASVLMGERRDLLLLDVLPLSLGIETLGGAVSKILLRNTTIPCLASEEFTTSVDQQTSVSVHVLQGERELVEDCRSLARFKIRIPPMPAGLPRLKVTFTVDENGILAVNAEELRSGKTAGVEVFPSIGISQEKVDRLIEESIENALEDFDIRMLVELRNKGQRILFATDRVWDKAVDYYSREDLELLQSLMSELRQALSRGEKDQARLQLLVDQLGDMTRPLADHVFSSATREALAGKSMGEV